MPDKKCQITSLSLSNQDMAGLMEAVLSKKTPFRFSARGTSMAPFIKDRDILTVEPIQNLPLTIGDVVAFRSPANEKLVIHRLVSRHGNDYVVKGDNLLHPDGSVPVERIYGKVAAIQRQSRSCRFGMGPERKLIALLSRLSILTRLVRAYILCRSLLTGKGA